MTMKSRINDWETQIREAEKRNLELMALIAPEFPPTVSVAEQAKKSIYLYQLLRNIDNIFEVSPETELTIFLNYLQIDAVIYAARMGEVRPNTPLKNLPHDLPKLCSEAKETLRISGFYEIYAILGLDVSGYVEAAIKDYQWTLRVLHDKGLYHDMFRTQTDVRRKLINYATVEFTRIVVLTEDMHQRGQKEFLKDYPVRY